MKLPGKISICGLLLALGMNAGATVLTFDDISADFGGTIADGYGGLNWGNFGYLYTDQFSYWNSGYELGTVSGDYVTYNMHANVGTAGGGLFNFDGAYLTGAWRDGLSIEVSGYKDGGLLYQSTVVVDHDAATWFDFDFFGIDQLQFSSYGGSEVDGLFGNGAHFVMDNFTLNEAPVPEPSSLVLLGLALCGMGMSYRRRAR